MLLALISVPDSMLRAPPLVTMFPTVVVVPDCRLIFPEEVVSVPVDILVPDAREIAPDDVVCRFPKVPVPPVCIVMEPPPVCCTLETVNIPAAPQGQFPRGGWRVPVELKALSRMEPELEERLTFRRLRLPPVELFPVILTVAFDVLIVPTAPDASVIPPVLKVVAEAGPFMLPPARPTTVLELVFRLPPNEISLAVCKSTLPAVILPVTVVLPPEFM